jgi:hypothetical protein
MNLDRALMQQYMSIKIRFIIVSNTENEVFEKYSKHSIAGDLMDSAEAVTDMNAFLIKE